jgi:creatinine amidohydrolase
MSADFDAGRYELLRPHELRAIVAARPVVYVPLGTYEWHGEHLPVGLDALTAHGVCLRAAARDGGVVLPPLYYGTGGGHSAYPWTVMMQTDAEISALVSHTLGRLQDLDFRLAVVFSGHFAPTQLEMIARLAADWNAMEGMLRVVSIGVNQIEGLALAPDHAALFETTLLAELHPDRVAVDKLPRMTSGPELDSWSQARHDPSHPLYGIFGPDPRAFDKMNGPRILDDIVAQVIAKVRTAFVEHG